MSVTTTSNPVSATVLQVLTDYGLHHSGDPARPQTPSRPPRDRPPTGTAENPENWDREHRRVPPYRPIDRTCLGSERPGGVDVMETVFIYVMLHGVGLVSNVDTVWRATGGKINDRIFRYSIGGEW